MAKREDERQRHLEKLRAALTEKDHTIEVW